MPDVNPKALLKKLGQAAGNTPGTGMSDDVPAQIDGKEPAALSAGEYVIPADVVSMLGDGNTEAGVTVLDQMIAGVREAKMGKAEQPKPMAELFAGGKVKGKYATGGKVMDAVNKNQKVAPPSEPPGISLGSLLRTFQNGAM